MPVLLALQQRDLLMPNRDAWLLAAGVTAVILAIAALGVATVFVFSWLT
ncbi:hypothetical protein [Amycolatopsis speibonae]|uniref:Uncharacterized protein n=1 Tax=Amycolatopsis speibonae TaxID=1450224 RepID=A0ABV7P7W1_9PSEU